MKYVYIGIIMTFALLFTASSGISKGESFAIPEQRNGYYYYEDQYDKDSLFGIDKELLEKIDKELFEGIDKNRLLDNALNLLNELDIDIGALNEELLQSSEGYGGAFVLILVLFILLVIIGAGFGFGGGG